MIAYDYFKEVEGKYKSTISLQKPFVVRFDGKNVCKNPCINILQEYKGSLSLAMQNTAKFLSKRYNCLAYTASDEINLVFNRPKDFYNKFKMNDTQKISTLLVQEVFLNINREFKGELILFDARTFSINENKLHSYLLHRRNVSENTLVQYYAKKYAPTLLQYQLSKAKLEEALSEKTPDFNRRTDYQKFGAYYFNGFRTSMENYIERESMEEFY